MKTHTLIFLPAFLLSALLGMTSYAGIACAESSLVFENVWIAEAPPVSKVLAAYMTIRNATDKEQKIISAASDDFESIEFHRTVDSNGMASMQQQQHLIVPAGGTLTLKPGDYHMMLFKPVRKLQAGDQSVFQLKLDNDDSITATAIVKKASSEDSHEHHHH